MFSPDATDSEIMGGMKYMVGDPANSERVWQIIKPSRLTNPATLKSEASMVTPIDDWWAPPGDTPYLVVQGMRDKSAPPENARMLKQELGERMTLVELPEAGHLAPVENPNEVANAVVSLLRGTGTY
jgi:pimeloyl-ACP methyl ester carboxylesterase